MLKKGAMFGLDARIALAIFGALSLISGAALYSAIRESKVVSVLAEADEVSKAVGQYILDTRSELPTASAANLSIKALIVEPSGVKNWNGPYLSYEGHATADSLIHKSQRYISLGYRKSGDWANFSSGFCAQSDPTCIIYVIFENNNISLNQDIDESVDGSLGTASEEYTGNIRYNSQWLDIKTDIPYSSSLAVTP